MMAKPETLKAAEKEIKANLYDPYMKDHKTFDFKEAITYDNIQNFVYLKLCVSEALRMEPPVMYSSTNTVTEDL